MTALATRRLFIAGHRLRLSSRGQFDIPAIRRRIPNIEIGAMTIPAS